MSALRSQVERFLAHLKERRDSAETIGLRLFLTAKFEEVEKILATYFAQPQKEPRRFIRQY